MDDDELIARVADRDEDALRELFARHAPWLAARLRSVLPPSDVEDVLQETFLAVWKGAARYRPEGVGGGWIAGIARRQAALFLRRGAPASVLLPEEQLMNALQGADAADAAVSRVDLAAAVDALGPPGSPERETWQWLFVEDRPVVEVAKLMGVAEGTVKSRAHRTRRLLRAALLGHSPVTRIRGDRHEG